ncbi:MAG: enoyl-CoA hydratase/isomerase family protein [Syntrophobacterales bacterium]|nr:enoyl-CoA hydratase/isomerase family protein [Syntrophobacterales bacterium]
MYNTVILDKRAGFAIITMNRPREMNALCREMRAELHTVLDTLENDDDVKALIITGGDYVFSAGMDIKEMAALGDHEINEYFDSILKYLRKIYTYNKPVIAAVGGIALGGGFNIATVCDLIVASESAIFGHPELKFGLNPLFSPLRNLVGMAKAKEISMLGEPIGAREALRIGLVNKVATPEKFMEEAVAMAEGLAARSDKAIYSVKKLSVVTDKLDKQSALEMEFEVMVHLFSSPERKMRMSEFMTREYMSKMKKG